MVKRSILIFFGVINIFSAVDVFASFAQEDGFVTQVINDSFTVFTDITNTKNGLALSEDGVDQKSSAAIATISQSSQNTVRDLFTRIRSYFTKMEGIKNQSIAEGYTRPQPQIKSYVREVCRRTELFLQERLTFLTNRINVFDAALDRSVGSAALGNMSNNVDQYSANLYAGANQASSSSAQSIEFIIFGETPVDRAAIEKNEQAAQSLLAEMRAEVASFKDFPASYFGVADYFATTKSQLDDKVAAVQNTVAGMHAFLSASYKFWSQLPA